VYQLTKYVETVGDQFKLNQHSEHSDQEPNGQRIQAVIEAGRISILKSYRTDPRASSADRAPPVFWKSM